MPAFPTAAVRKAANAVATPAAGGDPNAALIKTNFGAFGWMVDIPELNTILVKASAEKWSPEEIVTAVTGSHWAKTHNTQAQSFAVLRREHPQEAEQQARALADTYKTEAVRIGLALDPQRAHDLAVHALETGLTPQEQHDALLADWHFDPSKAQGASGTELSTLRAKASAYGVPVSDGALGQWVDQIMRGTANEDSFDSYLREQAKSLFPSLAAAIDSGVTVRQYADPYLQLIQKELGVSADSVDFTDPKWQKFLVNVDPKTGDRVSMNLDDTLRTLRTDPVYGWGETVGAKNMISSFGQNLGKMFGKVPA